MRSCLAFIPALAVALAALAAAAPAAADVARPYDFDNQTRIVVGVTVSGHIMLSAGLEHLASEDWSLRGELLWALADTPAFGVQGSVTRRWRLDSGAVKDPAATARWGQISAGPLLLLAREKDGTWRHLPLWSLAPGLRWGLGKAGSLDLELPICWFQGTRRVMPIGLQGRWQGREPLID